MIEVLIVVGLTTVIAAVAIPIMANTVGNFRLGGDARSVSNAISLAKLRAAATFSKSRVYIDLNTNGFRIERWVKTGPGAWVAETGLTYLKPNDIFSVGPVGSAPPNTQTTIAQSSPCLTALNVAIGNTACILFNSRGIPVDTSGAPTPLHAVYLTDNTNTAVYGATLSATGMIRLWRTPPAATPTWTQQ